MQVSIFGIGCGLLTASSGLIIFFRFLLLQLGFVAPKGVLIKPFLIEEDDLNCKKKYSEPRLEYPPQKRLNFSSEYEHFLYVLLFLVPVLIVLTSGFGIASLCTHFVK